MNKKTVYHHFYLFIDIIPVIYNMFSCWHVNITSNTNNSSDDLPKVKEIKELHSICLLYWQVLCSTNTNVFFSLYPVGLLLEFVLTAVITDI